MSNGIWKIVGASATGTAHEKNGRPCQDAFGYRMLPDGGLVMAVSDGAGSALYAAEGSAYIVSAVLGSLVGKTDGQMPVDAEGWDALMRRGFSETRERLGGYVSSFETAFRDYAATLLAVILTDSWTVAGLVGDCAAAGVNGAGELVSLLPPQKSEYVNMTNFLTQRNALDMLGIIVFPEAFQSMALFSDGLLTLALNVADNRPYAPFFNPLFAFAGSADDETGACSRLHDFLNSDRVNARTDDDKTLLLATRIAGGERRM